MGNEDVTQANPTTKVIKINSFETVCLHQSLKKDKKLCDFLLNTHLPCRPQLSAGLELHVLHNSTGQVTHILYDSSDLSDNFK